MNSISATPMHGTVLTGRNNIFTVRANHTRYLCRIKGKTLTLDERSYNPLAPGDLVALSGVDPVNETAVIDERLPRRNAFQRYNRKGQALQTLAANVDFAVVVMSVSEPGFRDRFVDRVLALSEYHEIEAIVALTKSDLDPQRAEREAERYRTAGYRAFMLRTDLPESNNGLLEILAGHRSVLVGQSGVGKSTLLNWLLGSDHQKISAVSGKNRQGRHTTNAAHLIESGSFEIVDTPGIRDLDCRHIPPAELDRQFRDFRGLIDACAHDDCSHTVEPDCAVRAAVRARTIDPARYESYLRLLEELADPEEDFA